MKNKRWRVQIRGQSIPVGTYRTAVDAATAADRYIIDTYEPRNGIATIGAIKLNFPEKWPTVEQRAIAYLQKAGFIDHGKITLAPEFPDDLEQPVEVPYDEIWEEEDDPFTPDKVEIMKWYRSEDTDRPSWWDTYYWDNEKNTAEFKTMSEFKYAVENGLYDPR
jgi:hypothetical protein